jgi:hypothetical protein
MATSPPAARPSLYFDTDGVERLRRRAATTHRRYFDALRRWVDAPLDRRPRRGVDAGFVQHSSEVYFAETSSFLANVMLAYLVTGEGRDAIRTQLVSLRGKACRATKRCLGVVGPCMAVTSMEYCPHEGPRAQFVFHFSRSVRDQRHMTVP